MGTARSRRREPASAAGRITSGPGGDTLSITITREPLDAKEARQLDFLNWDIPEEETWHYWQDYGALARAGWINRETAEAFIAWAIRKFHADVLLAPYTKRSVAASEEPGSSETFDKEKSR